MPAFTLLNFHRDRRDQRDLDLESERHHGPTQRAARTARPGDDYVDWMGMVGYYRRVYVKPGE